MKKVNTLIETSYDSSSEYDIEIFNLSKHYKIRGKNNRHIIALNNVNLKVKKGEIFGLLGPNGAGKTTMVSILTTLIQPTSGYATILEHNILKNPWFIKNNVGLMLGGTMIYYRMTGYRNLKFFCNLYGIKNFKSKIKEIAENVNLTDWLDQYVEHYSTGMKVKLALARVMLIDPKILFLDEPMVGLDPNSVREMIEIILGLNKTIFLTSHQMNIVERLCDRIAFLKQGEILKVDNQENFKRILKEKINIRIQVRDNKDKLMKCLNSLEFTENVEDAGEFIYFSVLNEKYYQELFDFLKDYPIIQFNEIQPSLSDVFVKLSSKNA
ncbi:MAG: ATP-binding cassette domain-containing protein [Candidatus Hodarchaeota archaeon]